MYINFNYFSYICTMYRNRNKEKQKEYARKHYLANKEKMIEKAKKYNSSVYERNLNYIKNYLSNNPCVDCGNNNIVVLEFDHVRGEKKYNVSDMYRGGYSLAIIQKEIDKCDVRCANCHRQITHLRRNL